MNPETKRWFIEKLAKNPEYLADVYLPEMEKISAKAETAFREAIRSDSCDSLGKIKYRMGWLDGVQRAISVIDGLRLSEKKPAEPGLMARIFPGFRSETPASLG